MMSDEENITSEMSCEDHFTGSKTEEDSDEDFFMVTKYVSNSIEYVRKFYDKRPMWTSALSESAYIQEVLHGHQGVCYEMFV